MISRSKVLITLLSVSLGACSYYPKEDGEKLHDEVYGLMTKLTALNESVKSLQQDSTQQGKSLSAINKEVAELSKVARRNDADIGVQLDEMLQKTAAMRGQVETFSERVSTLEANIAKVQEELDLRFSGLQEEKKITEAKSEAEKKKAIDEARKRERMLGKPKVLFKYVQGLIDSDKAVEARKLLREFMIRADKDRGLKKYQAHGQYLIGESYLASGKFQQAAAEFNQVRKRYPKSKWVAHALYKLGICFENLKLTDDAKLFYKTIKRKYRRSEVYRLAVKRLKNLK